MKKLLTMIGAVALGSSVQMPLLADTVYWKADAGGDITSSSNWTNSLGNAVVPAAGDVLDFSNITSAQTLTGSFEDNRAFSCAKFGTGIVTLEGNLHFTTLTNANKLAVASTGVLRIDNDLAAFQYTYYYNAYMTFLCSNEGDVSVGGYAVGGADVRGCGNYGHVRQYETHTSASTPIKAKGLRCLIAYATSPLFYLATASAPGEWIVGSGGLVIENGQNNDRVNYRVEGAATLRSIDNWTLGKSAKNSVNKDLYVTGSGNLVIDTTDYDDGTTPHTVTLEGRLVADKVQGAATVAIVGCGTNVIATSVSHGDNRSTKIENAISVEGTATLQINDDASYIISNVLVAAGATLHIPSTTVNTSGTTIIESVSLASGSTLSLPSTSATALAARSLPSVTLPAEGKAYLRIDGPALKAGEYTVLDSVPSGYASHLSVVGTAIGTRSVWLSDDGSSLKLIVPPKGLIISFF